MASNAPRSPVNASPSDRSVVRAARVGDDGEPARRPGPGARRARGHRCSTATGVRPRRAAGAGSTRCCRGRTDHCGARCPGATVPGSPPSTHRPSVARAAQRWQQSTAIRRSPPSTMKIHCPLGESPVRRALRAPVAPVPAARAQAPRAQAPRAQAPRAQAPRAQAPRAQAPRARAPQDLPREARRCSAARPRRCCIRTNSVAPATTTRTVRRLRRCVFGTAPPMGRSRWSGLTRFLRSPVASCVPVGHDGSR